jgi:dTDP-4-amino-4,6-dideoxygalactose transaminase
MIPFFRPWLGDQEHQALLAPLRRAWLTQGPEVEALETEFAAYVGAPYAVAVSNGTTALHLMLLACGIGPEDEVIAPSHSFIATCNAIRYVGARVVFVDIEPLTLNLDQVAVRQALSSRTKAILAVHQFGMPCDLGALLALSRQAGVMLLEDAACAVGSQIQLDGEWQRIGKPHGMAATFSFHPRKLMTSGEGGMVVTADADLAARVRLLRQHGMGITGHQRHTQSQSPTYLELGYNFRLSDLLAAVGRVQLSRLDQLLERRGQQFERYTEAFGDRLQRQPAWARSNRQTAALHVDAETSPMLEKAREMGVSLGSGIVNSHETPAYPPQSWICRGDLSHSERASRQTLLLPLYHDLTEEEQETVIRAVEEVLSLTPS